MPIITTIIFDLAEVLIRGYHGTEHLVAEKTNISLEEFLAVRQKTDSLFLDAMRGNLSELEYFTRMVEYGGWDISPGELAILARKNHSAPFDNSAFKVAKSLQGKYELILLSDCLREWGRYVQDIYADLDIFEKKLFSYDLGFLKRDTHAFRMVAHKLKVWPEECIFIDDWDINVAAAIQQGMHAVHYTTPDKLRVELKDKFRV